MSTAITRGPSVPSIPDVYKRQIQDGSRVMFETVINIDTPREELTIGEEPVDLDGLNLSLIHI